MKDFNINNREMYLRWFLKTHLRDELCKKFVEVLSDNKISIPSVRRGYKGYQDYFDQTSSYFLAYIIAYNSDIELDKDWCKFIEQCKYLETIPFEKCTRCDKMGTIRN